MPKYQQSTDGFMEQLGTYLESLTSVSLTKGTNLFEEQYQVDTVQGGQPVDSQYVIFSDGFEEDPASSFRKITWSVRFSVRRKRRDSALDALRPIVSEILSDGRISLTGFSIIKSSVVIAPEFVAQDEDGRFEAQATLAFIVIPK